ITIASNVLEGYNANEINEQIKTELKNYNLPKNTSISFTGEQESQAEEMAFLSKALLIAVFFIFLILVAQFNSTSTPIIISLTVLLSLIGVLLGLIVFRMEFVIMMTMIGIISLAGIVVNNAIVLIDYTNLVMVRKRLEEGLDEGVLTKEIINESIVEGGKTRLRPVLLTAITTVLGLVPLAVGININFMTLFTEFDPEFYIGGENVAFWGPMSWTIIFGLTFATFLTLIIVPVMYQLLNNFKFKLDRKQ
ncbi:MAG: efflux RND transporter permease subunit, partial [Lutibacter sp.]